MSCSCQWGWLSDGTRCPTHFCGQPAPDIIEQWVIAEDDSPHPRTVWLEQRAREVFRVDRTVQAVVTGRQVVLRRPIWGETWYADTHLTGHTRREILDWDLVATVDVSPTGEAVAA